MANEVTMTTEAYNQWANDYTDLQRQLQQAQEVREQVLADVSRILDAHIGYYSEEFKRELCTALDELEEK